MSLPHSSQTAVAPIKAASPLPSISPCSSNSSTTDSIHSNDAAPVVESAVCVANPIKHYTSNVEIPDEIYDRIPHHRKLIIVALLSFCSFLAPISSTTVLSAVPEVALEYGTSGAVINISNALYMASMGISPCIWGPLSQVYGRRLVCCFPIIFLCKGYLAWIWADLMIDMSLDLGAVPGLLYWHGVCAKFGGFLRFQNAHCFRRDVLPYCWSLMHWYVLSMRSLSGLLDVFRC